MTEHADRWQLIVALLRNPERASQRLAARLEKLPVTCVRCRPGDGSGAAYLREMIAEPKRRRRGARGGRQ